jgi:hypothetical protein
MYSSNSAGLRCTEASMSLPNDLLLLAECMQCLRLFVLLPAGYGAPLAPNPECTLVNVIIMFQVITSSLIDYCCMGLVFARCAAGRKACWQGFSSRDCTC